MASMTINSGSEPRKIDHSVLHSVTTAVGDGLRTIKQGFLSCLECVANSLETMGRYVQSGLRHVASALGSLLPNKSKAAGNPKLNTIQPATAEALRLAMTQRMDNNPDYMAGMFRESLEQDKIRTINAALKQPEKMTEAIQRGDVSGTNASACIKRWLGETIGENKLTAAEIESINALKYNSQAVKDLISERMGTDAQRYDIFCSLLSVPQRYKEICETKGVDTTSPYNLTVLTNAGLPLQIFSPEAYMRAPAKCNDALFVLMEHCSR
ncbi:hypothetical protein V1599_15035 [Enterobacter sp. ECC-175]|uniref:hypothetical protein n=1 Tax=Enterobacter sp. ECC-175 TaxID=3116479 RepID=UPI002633F112|nr:hypothetical protein [uncultured Enterobacter sp.]